MAPKKVKAPASAAGISGPMPEPVDGEPPSETETEMGLGGDGAPPPRVANSDGARRVLLETLVENEQVSGCVGPISVQVLLPDATIHELLAPFSGLLNEVNHAVTLAITPLTATCDDLRDSLEAEVKLRAEQQAEHILNTHQLTRTNAVSPPSLSAGAKTLTL